MNIINTCLAKARANQTWYYRLLFFLLALIFFNTVSAEAGVTFSWLANPAQENVTGYRLYYGAQSRFDTSGKLKTGFAYDYYLDFAASKRCVPGAPIASCVNLTSSDYTCTNLSGSAPQCTVNNLQGLLYFALTAYNATGESGLTSELSATVGMGSQPPTDTTAPVIASGPTVNSITGTSANIQWSTNEQAATVLRYGLTSGNLNRIVSVSTYQTAHQQTLTGLQAGTRYYFRIESTDTSGNTGYGAVANFTTKAAALPRPPPDTTAPVITFGPKVNNITRTSANIQWNTNEQAATVLRYGLTSGNLNRIVSVSTYQTAHQQALTGLQAGTRYYFRIVSTDPSGNRAYGSVANFRTKAASSLAASSVTDPDGDGIIDVSDNCPAAFNPDQADKNGNGLGDACEKFNWNLFLPLMIRNNGIHAR